MIHQYDIHFLVGGVVAIDLEDQGTVVIDTGSPATFMNRRSLNFLGNQITVPGNIQNVTSEYLTANLHAPVNGLIGMDQLSSKIVSLDYSQQKITFCDNRSEIPRPLLQYPMEKSYGLPLMEVKIGNHHHKGVLDTGAHLSYAHPDLCNGLIQNGVAEDFNPICGHMTSPKFMDFKYQLDEINFQHDILQANQSLLGLMNAIRIKLIFGFEFFIQRPVALDFPQSAALFY